MFSIKALMKLNWIRWRSMSVRGEPVAYALRAINSKWCNMRFVSGVLGSRMCISLTAGRASAVVLRDMDWTLEISGW
jgi:hypothetical protein